MVIKAKQNTHKRSPIFKVDENKVQASTDKDPKLAVTFEDYNLIYNTNRELTTHNDTNLHSPKQYKTKLKKLMHIWLQHAKDKQKTWQTKDGFFWFQRVVKVFFRCQKGY